MEYTAVKPGVFFVLFLCFALLFIPLPGMGGDRLLMYLQDFAHLPLFAIITFLYLWMLERRIAGAVWRTIAAVALSLVTSVMAECIQPWVGRTSGIRDVVLGITGSVDAACVYWTPRCRGPLTKVALSMMAILLIIGAAWPGALIAWDRRAARRDFPQLASFETRTELSRWMVNGCNVSRGFDNHTMGQWALKIEVTGPERYPGLFEADGVYNFLGMKALCFDLYVSGKKPRVVWIRVDDRADPVYADRFQECRTLYPGMNPVCVDRAVLERTPSGRLLDLKHIRSWGVFFDQAEPGDIFYLDNVRLRME